eukprot:5970225-Prymnesium_polylepis.1
MERGLAPRRRRLRGLVEDESLELAGDHVGPGPRAKPRRPGGDLGGALVGGASRVLVCQLAVAARDDAEEDCLPRRHVHGG